MVSKKWLNGKETAKILGISIWHLANLRAELTRGVHYRNIAPKTARRATYRYNPEAIALWLNKK